METKSQSKLPQEIIKCFECGLARDTIHHMGASNPKTCARQWVQKNCKKGNKRGCSTTLMVDGKPFKIAQQRSRQRGYLFGGRALPKKDSVKDLRTLCDD